MSEPAAARAEAENVRLPRILRAAALASAVALGLSGFAPTASAAAVATTDPALNVPPSPDYWPTCLQDGAGSAACIDAVLAAIDSARAAEGVAPMVLPTGFASLSPAEQTFVVSNLERVDRGLSPAAGMVDSLDTLSLDAANADADPLLSSWTVGPFSANRWGSIWAGDLNALAADYDWMYDDGWGPDGSYNLDCTSATAGGCWGHRHNILSSYGDQELITGVGAVQQSSWLSIAQIFVAGTGTYPAFTRAWSAFAPTGTAPTAATASPNTAPPADATVLDVAAPTFVTAGRSGHITGTLVDTATGAGVAGEPVTVCARVAGASTSSCSATTTDAGGAVSVTVRPRLTTSYRVTFPGDPTHAASASITRVVHVRPALHLRGTRTGSSRELTVTVSPVRAQVVRVQRHTAAGWSTVRRTTAHSVLRFRKLRPGAYRVVVNATSATAMTTAPIRLS